MVINNDKKLINILKNEKRNRRRKKYLEQLFKKFDAVWNKK